MFQVLLTYIIQLSIALLKSSRMKLVKKKTTFGLTGIFKMLFLYVGGLAVRRPFPLYIGSISRRRSF